MNRLLSIFVSGIVGAVLLGGGSFAYLMLAGPRSDPSVYGTALLSAIILGAIGFVVGALYKIVRR